MPSRRRNSPPCPGPVLAGAEDFYLLKPALLNKPSRLCLSTLIVVFFYFPNDLKTKTHASKGNFANATHNTKTQIVYRRSIMKKVSIIKSISLPVITVFLFMGLGTWAYAFGPGRFCGGPCGFGPGALKCLNLTADQKKQIAGILEKYQPQVDQSMAEIRKMHELGLKSGAAGEFSEKQIRAKFREAMPKLEDMFVLRAKIRNEIEATLTKDQVLELSKKREKCIDKKKDCMKSGKARMKNWFETETE
jgi:Spy/CpxP family protein refolding chaperone